MTASERWQRAKELLHEASQRNRADRAAFLTEACAGDDEMRREVEALLAAHDEAGDFIEKPAMHIPLIGRTAGHYTILSQIGAGGMGEVYLARDDRLDRKVALKVLPPGLTRDGERLRRFQQEASAASRLNHPNIVTIYDVGHVGEAEFIATEYIDGVTLRDRTALKAMSIAEAIEITLQVAAALAAAHGAGIVHRDIKPENLMLRADGYVKVLDFGIAKLMSSPVAAAHVNTMPGTVMGTVRYMSPEQARGLDVDPRTDIWSLGVVLYEMITRRVPFEGATSADILVSILEHPPRPMADFREGVPPDLERIVMKALERDPRKRYRAIEQMIDDLRAVAHDARGDVSSVATTVIEGRAHTTGSSNLSTHLPPLIGRGAETDAVKARLRNEATRLLTLTGPGGTGKTRLAQHVARDLIRDYPDGVFFVALAPLTDPDLVPAAIAQVLGIQETSARRFAEGLKNVLRDKTMLLVLDNFEHVVAAAPVVAGVLAEAPGVKVLATSRAPLHLTDEEVFVVRPLALPAADEVGSAEQLLQSGAAALFVQRLLAARPQFRLGPENLRVIADLCIRLDGLPLALELAAARTRLLSVDELLARMTHTLNLLKGGPRDLPERQQTMRSTIAWSYDLLAHTEKMLFHRLGVFSGGCSLAACEAVCGDVLDDLESLVDESLVVKRDAPDGSYRFTMMETIREYSAELLEASGEADAMRRRHAEMFARMAEEAEPHLMSAGREPWLARLDADHNNFRAALRWAADHDHVEIALRIAGALRWFWYFRGHIGEGYHWATELLAKPGASQRNALRAKVLATAGSLAFYYSDPVAACPLLEESVALWRELGDRRQLAYTLVFTSLAVSLSRRDGAAARAAAAESVALFRELGDQWGLALALTYAGVIAWAEPSLDVEAAALFQESYAIFGTLGDGWGIAGAILYLGALREEAGDKAGAIERYERFLTLSRASKDMWRVASGLDVLAALLRSQGETERADQLTEESAVLQRKLGKPMNLRQAWDRARARRNPT